VSKLYRTCVDFGEIQQKNKKEVKVKGQVQNNIGCSYFLFFDGWFGICDICFSMPKQG
jgi:hypothetical protein